MVRHRSTVDEKMKLLEEIDGMGNIQRFMSPRMQTTRAVWSVISQQLEGKGVQFSASQCRVTWRDLKHYFFKDLTQHGSAWMVKMPSCLYEKLLQMWNKAGRPEANKSPEEPITSTAELPLSEYKPEESPASPPRRHLHQKTTYKHATGEKIKGEQKNEAPKRIKVEEAEDFSGFPTSSTDNGSFSNVMSADRRMPLSMQDCSGPASPFPLIQDIHAGPQTFLLRGHSSSTPHQCMGSAEISAHNSELMSHALMQMQQTLQDLTNSVLRLEHRQEQQQQQIVSLLTQIRDSAFGARNTQS
ncbi:uncharacterized protein [Ambystoma mexicanum]|uniref:uncharacterized protein isoform X2 n=1 Tax=Ambystoma mexicanum TaxID=8296 RepID=UPI0037E88B6D